MRNFSKIFLTLLAASAACFAVCGCADSQPTNAPDPNAANVTTTVTSTTTTTAPKPPGAAASATTPENPAAENPAAENPTAEKLPADDKFDQKDAPKAGEKVAVITTNYGVIVFRFLPSMAPNTVKNFEKLADQKFYDGTKFHRVIPDFMIQGGDPNSKDGGNAALIGQGGPGYTIKAEFNTTHHMRGVVSMARSQDPDSAGSQFFICVSASPSVVNLDGQYTAFGKVVKGMNVVDKIVNLPSGSQAENMPNPGVEAIMKTVRIQTWPLK